MFTASFCQALLEELDHFEQSDMPKGRPNTMNNYGVGEAPPGGPEEVGTLSGETHPQRCRRSPSLGFPICKMRSQQDYYEVKHVDVCKALNSVFSKGLPQGPRVRPYQFPR